MGKEVLLRLKSRHWVVDDRDRIIMGEGRKEILETIEKTGSINKTAKKMKMSYKGVWSKSKSPSNTWEKASSMRTEETAAGSRLKGRRCSKNTAF